jgi:uncharacterized protein DUF6152
VFIESVVVENGSLAIVPVSCAGLVTGTTMSRPLHNGEISGGIGMRTKFGFFVALFSLVGAGAAYAHHSFSTEYDGTKTFEVKGTVSKVEWTNPHARFYVDINENGKVVTWNMELASPSALARNGWTSRTLKVGDEVTVKGYAAKVAQYRGDARSVITADGRSLFGGASDDGRPQQ